MWQRGVHAERRETALARTGVGEKQARDQAAACNAARFIPAARIKSAKRYKEPVGRNIAVTTENATGTLLEIGNHHNVGLVVSGAGFEPCLPLAHLIGGSQVCVPVGSPDFQTAEFVEQKKVDHTSDCAGAIHSRGAILEEVRVIDHPKRKQV